MKNPIIHFLLFFTIPCLAQGIHFEKDLSWEQVLEQANKEDKLIFADCYTTWCAPCKQMDKETFSDSAVGVFYNEHFVSIKVQMDQTKKDSDWTKAWYPHADEWHKKYKVNSYPTYLVFDKNGTVVNRSGSYQPAEKFLETGKMLINTEDGYYAKLTLFEAGSRDSILLRDLLVLTHKFHDQEQNAIILESYLEQQENWLLPENMKLILESNVKFRSRLYDFLVAHTEEISQKRTQARNLQHVLYIAAHEALIQPNLGPKADWSKVKDTLAYYIPDQSELYLFKAKVKYLSRHIDLMEMQALVNECISTGKDEWKYHAYNEFATAIAYEDTEKAAVEQAKKWIDELAISSSMVRARLAYKLGETQEAIDLIEADLARKFPPMPELIISEYRSIIDKMKLGQKL